MPATSNSRPRPFHTGRKASSVPERTTDIDTVEQTRRTLAEAALARIQEGARERALFREVEELMLQRGVVVSHETVRR